MRLNYNQTGSVTEAQRSTCPKNEDRNAPLPEQHGTLRWVRYCKSTGKILSHRWSSGSRNILTLENFERVRTTLELGTRFLGTMSRKKFKHEATLIGLIDDRFPVYLYSERCLSILWCPASVISLLGFNSYGPLMAPKDEGENLRSLFLSATGVEDCYPP